MREPTKDTAPGYVMIPMKNSTNAKARRATARGGSYRVVTA